MSDTRLGLLELGTRWEHYAEIRELFACGVEILKNLSVKSITDRDKLKKLEGAVELLDGRINLLADFHFQTTYGSKLRQVIDGDVDNIYRKNKRDDAKNKVDDDSEGSQANPST
jgi:4-hydroxy-3-methylbut-2-en-1-yl diphosphate synthase IspG/GcpE